MVMPFAIETKLVYLSEDITHTNIPNAMKLGIWEVKPV